MLEDLEYQNQGGGYGHNHQAHGSGYGNGMQMQQPYSGYQNMSQNGYSGPNMYPNGSNHQGSGYYSSQAMPPQGGGYGYYNPSPNPNPSALGGANIMSTVSNMMGGGSSSHGGGGGGMKMGEMVEMAKQGYQMYQKVQHPTGATQQTKHHGQQLSSCPSMNYHNGDAMGWARNGRRSSQWD